MQVLAPHISCVVTPNEFQAALDQGFKEIYIITSQGTLKHHQLRGNGRFVRLKVDKIPGYEEVKIEQGMNFLPAGKIPYSLYEQVLAFFKKVMEVKSSELEAMIHILWNAEKGYHLGVPPQTISKASVSYDWNYIPAGTSIVVDIHSHNTMGAFFSGTDDNDDRKNISFSGVFGKLKDKEPQTVWRFNYYDKKFEADISHIFEAPPQAPAVEIPQEWLDQVKTVTYGYQGGTRGQGNVVSIGQSGGRSYDHLKQYQFQKKDQSSNISPGSSVSSSSNRPTRNQAVDEHADAGMQGTFFGHDFEFMDPALEKQIEEMADYYASMGIRPVGAPKPQAKWSALGDGRVFDAKRGMYVQPEDHSGFTSGEAALASVKEDASVDFEMGKPGVETLNSMDLEQEPRSALPGYTNARYEDICAVHGVDVADAWFAIDQEMAALDGKDEINIDLMSDFFNFISEDGQVKLIRKLFEQLPRKQREALETNGL